MAKLIIEHEAAARKEMQPLDFGRTPRLTGREPNPGAYMLRPYERYLEIEIDMRWIGPHVVTVRRKIQEVRVVDEGSDREALDWSIAWVKTGHYLDAKELSAAWPEIEMRKTQGATLVVHHLPQLLKHSYGAVNYIGI